MPDTLQALLEFATRLVHLTPPGRPYCIADAVSSVIWAIAPHLRRRTQANFARALGVSARDPQARCLARMSVRNFGRMAMDFLWLRALVDEEVAAVTALEDDAHLWDALNAKRGVVLVLPHLGCWDVAAARASAAHLPITIVTEESWAARLALRSRARPGVSIVLREHSVRPLLRALARNEGVVLLSDLARPGLSTLDVSLFGSPAPLPDGPARLSLRTGAPVLALVCVRTSVRRFRVVFRPPLWPDGHDVQSLTACVALEFECLIRDHLDQWYPFGRIWVD